MATIIALLWTTSNEAEVYAEFRVRKTDMERLGNAIGLQESFICRQRTRADKIEGLCTVLKRRAYPCRLNDLIQRFGRAVPELSMITNTVEKFIYQNHHHRVTRWNENLLSPVKLQEYSDAVTEKGSSLLNCSLAVKTFLYLFSLCRTPRRICDATFPALL